jgi:phospholipid/cholesterol/gamma-HCH transport system substrate-binding protein
VLAGLIAAIALVAIVMFGGSDAYTVTARFQNAGQLVKGNQVEVGGRPVGSVKSIGLADDGMAEVKFEVDGDLAPLHKGTIATIRASSLSGIANRYVALKPGPNSGPEIADGGRIGADETSAPVDLDQLFDTLDPKTRKGLQRVVQGSATWYGGRAKQAAASAKYLPPFLSTTSRLTQEVVLDEKTFERFLIDGANVVQAIAERRDDLASLVGNANTTAGAIADENVSLDRALQLLPGTMRKANTTFVNLRSTLDDLDPLVAESKPADQPDREDAAAREPDAHGLPAHDQGTQPRNAGGHLCARVHAGPDRVVRQVRPRRRELRRQWALRADPAPVQRLQLR